MSAWVGGGSGGGSSGSAAYRKQFSEWYQTISASQTDSEIYPASSPLVRVKAQRAGSITLLGIELYANVAAGSATFDMAVNGSKVVGAQLVMTSGKSARIAFAAGTYAVVAGDEIAVWYTTDGGYLPNNNGCSPTVEVTE